MLQDKPYDAHFNAYLNLAVPVMSASNPIEPKFFNAKFPNGSTLKFSVWDFLDINLGPDATLGQLVEHLETKYDSEVNMLSYGTSMIYFSLASAKKRKERAGWSIPKCIRKIAKTDVPPSAKVVLLDVFMPDDNDEEIEMPRLRFWLEK